MLRCGDRFSLVVTLNRDLRSLFPFFDCKTRLGSTILLIQQLHSSTLSSQAARPVSAQRSEDGRGEVARVACSSLENGPHPGARPGEPKNAEQVLRQTSSRSAGTWWQSTLQVGSHFHAYSTAVEQWPHAATDGNHSIWRQADKKWHYLLAEAIDW